MRFFTPELYRRYSATDGRYDMEAELYDPDEEWEEALTSYHAYTRSAQYPEGFDLEAILKLPIHDATIVRAEVDEDGCVLTYSRFPHDGGHVFRVRYAGSGAGSGAHALVLDAREIVYVAEVLVNAEGQLEHRLLMERRQNARELRLTATSIQIL